MTRPSGLVTAVISPVGWLRIAARGSAMVLLLAVCMVLWLICRPFTTHNPAPRNFMKGISRIVGLRIAVSGARTAKGAFLLPNHVSWLDIPALAGLTGTAFVAHDGLAALRWLRWLCEMNDTVFVARHDRASVAAQVDQVREAIRDTGSLTIFAEGTTGDGVDLLPFKSSLLSAISPVPPGISVQPVWLDFGADARDIAWFGDETGKDNFLRIAARSRPIPLTVHFLAPLAGEQLDSRKTIALAAREAILRRANSVRPAPDDQRVAL